MAVTEQRHIIEKVKKLFRLAGNNPNQEESEAAMMKAQELLASRGLSTSDVSLEEKKPEAIEEPLDLGTKGYPQWKSNLLYTICVNFRCDTYILNLARARWRRLVVVGLEEDVEIVKIIFFQAVACAEKAWKEFRADHIRRTGPIRQGRSRRMKNDFTYAFNGALGEKFRTNVEIHDLHPVIVTPPEVSECMKKKELKTGTKPQVRGTGSEAAYLAGHAAGSSFHAKVGEKPQLGD